MTPRLKILSGSSHPPVFPFPDLFCPLQILRHSVFVDSISLNILHVFFPLHDAPAVLALLRLPACRVTTPSIPSSCLHCTALHWPALSAASVTLRAKAPRPLSLPIISGAFFLFHRCCPPSSSLWHSRFTFLSIPRMRPAASRRNHSP